MLIDACFVYMQLHNDCQNPTQVAHLNRQFTLFRGVLVQVSKTKHETRVSSFYFDSRVLAWIIALWYSRLTGDPRTTSSLLLSVAV